MESDSFRWSQDWGNLGARVSPEKRPRVVLSIPDGLPGLPGLLVTFALHGAIPYGFAAHATPGHLRFVFRAPRWPAGGPMWLIPFLAGLAVGIVLGVPLYWGCLALVRWLGDGD